MLQIFLIFFQFHSSLLLTSMQILFTYLGEHTGSGFSWGQKSFLFISTDGIAAKNLSFSTVLLITVAYLDVAGLNN